MPGYIEPADRRRRFYRQVDTAAEAGGFAVRLDGRIARAPDACQLVLPTKALAEAVAAEWAAQVEYILPATMPTTRLAFAALSLAGGDDRAAVAARIASFAASDQLCYFADGPPALVAREEAHWEPVIAWAEQALSVRFVRVHGVLHQAQPQATLRRIEALAAEEPAFALAALSHAAGLFGSAILAFALRRGHLTATAAFDLSRLDETFQEERWGVDDEAAERTAGMRREAAVLEQWFEALV